MMVDNLSNLQRAEVLAQALPYVRKYNGKVIVVKYGGNAMVDPVIREQVMADIVLLWLIGVRVVVVHGGGPDISQLLERLGIQSQWVDGLRVTDEETIDVVQMTLAGKVNKTLVNLAQVQGGNAVGLSGMDGRLIQAVQKDPDLGYVGKIVQVNTQPLVDLLDNGYIPIVATLGCDEQGNVYNINGDTAAAYVAGALQAERMLLLTDVEGVLRDKEDPDSLIPEIAVADARALVQDGVVDGGMIPKLECCIEAIDQGVGNAVILDGRVAHAVLVELLTDEGAGTMIRGRAYTDPRAV